MADTQREIETKFDVAPDFDLGDPAELTALGSGAGGTVEISTVELASTYYDTADQALLRAHLTLRRRLGDDDTGWQLKVPGAGFRTELRWPLTEQPPTHEPHTHRAPTHHPGPEQPPDELRRLLTPWLARSVPAAAADQAAVADEAEGTSDSAHQDEGGATLAPLLTLRVTRTRYRLLDHDRNRIFELADDEVRASPGSIEPAAARWRELEVELGPAGTADHTRRAAELLTARGALASRFSSKLGHAVIGHPETGQPVGTAAAVLLAYLRTQCDAITAGHFAISLKPFEADAGSEPHEAIHQTRVATRRIRAALRTFAAFLDHDRAERLEAELAWFAAELGEVRDREVLRNRLHLAVTQLPDDLVIGPVAERIDQVLLAELHQHAEALSVRMHEQRYVELIAELGRWTEQPPFTELADQPSRLLGEYVQAAQRKLARRMRKARAAGGPDPLLHSARKAGKRARYAAEAAEPALGKQAHALAKAAEQLQTLLGEHQDAVVTGELLRRIAAQVAADGESTFTYGVLVADQLHTAERSARAARKAARH